MVANDWGTYLPDYENCSTAFSGSVVSLKWSTINASTSAAQVKLYTNKKGIYTNAKIGKWTWPKTGCTTGDDEWYDYHDNTCNATYTISDWEIFSSPSEHKVNPVNRIQEIIRNRHAPMILGATRKSMPSDGTPQEFRARETLRRVLGDEKFLRFMSDGFVTVRGKSGKHYQIFPGHGITNVFENGQKIDRLCVVLNGDFPPTDSLIMRYLLILNDEADFRKHAIKHSVGANYRQQAPTIDTRSLSEIFKELKGKQKRVA